MRKHLELPKRENQIFMHDVVLAVPADNFAGFLEKLEKGASSRFALARGDEGAAASGGTAGDPRIVDAETGNDAWEDFRRTLADHLRDTKDLMSKVCPLFPHWERAVYQLEKK